MGGWKADKAAQMTTRSGEYPYWSISLDIPMADLKESIKYKYVMVSNSGKANARWEAQMLKSILHSDFLYSTHIGALTFRISDRTP
jgi:hypothetical protein